MRSWLTRVVSNIWRKLVSGMRMLSSASRRYWSLRLVEQQLQEYRASAETSANLVKELEEKSRSHQKDAERSKAAAERAKSMLKKSTAQKPAEIDAAAAALEQAQALHSSRSEEFDRVC